MARRGGLAAIRRCEYHPRRRSERVGCPGTRQARPAPGLVGVPPVRHSDRGGAPLPNGIGFCIGCYECRAPALAFLEAGLAVRPGERSVFLAGLLSVEIWVCTNA